MMKVTRTLDQGELVRRAARTAGRSHPTDRRGTLRFLSVVVLVMIAGSLMVGFAWASRQYHHPTLFDSWQSAYGVYSCESADWVSPIESDNNPNGIRTRGDGVIYIEPTVESATGDGARLDVFFDNVGATLSNDALVLPDGTQLSENGTFCSGEEAVLQVHRWSAATDHDPVEVRYEGVEDMPFLNDGEVFAVALAPRGASIAMPPSAELLPDPSVAHDAAGTGGS